MLSSGLRPCSRGDCEVVRELRRPDVRALRVGQTGFWVGERTGVGGAVKEGLYVCMHRKVGSPQVESALPPDTREGSEGLGRDDKGDHSRGLFPVDEWKFPPRTPPPLTGPADATNLKQRLLQCH